MIQIFFLRFFGTLIYFGMRIYSLTLKIEVFNPEILDQAQSRSPTGNVIIAFWHHNLMASILGISGFRLLALVGTGSDGEMTAEIFKRYGHDCLRGSPGKGGKKLIQDTVQSLRENRQNAYMTVDGSGGPSYEPKKGCFIIAAQTQAPILPAIAVADRFWVTNRTWDKTRIPKPGSRVKLVFGHPLEIPQAEWLAPEILSEVTKKLKSELQALENQNADLTQDKYFEIRGEI